MCRLSAEEPKLKNNTQWCSISMAKRSNNSLIKTNYTPEDCAISHAAVAEAAALTRHCVWVCVCVSGEVCVSSTLSCHRDTLLLLLLFHLSLHHPCP